MKVTTKEIEDGWFGGNTKVKSGYFISYVHRFSSFKSICTMRKINNKSNSKEFKRKSLDQIGYYYPILIISQIRPFINPNLMKNSMCPTYVLFVHNFNNAVNQWISDIYWESLKRACFFPTKRGKNVEKRNEYVSNGFIIGRIMPIFAYWRMVEREFVTCMRNDFTKEGSKFQESSLFLLWIVIKKVKNANDQYKFFLSQKIDTRIFGVWYINMLLLSM